MARRELKERRKLSTERVEQSMPKINFVFEDQPEWMAMMYADMSTDEQALAKAAWRDAENADILETKEAATADAAGTVGPSADNAIRARMKDFMVAKLK